MRACMHARACIMHVCSDAAADQCMPICRCRCLLSARLLPPFFWDYLVASVLADRDVLQFLKNNGIDDPDALHAVNFCIRAQTRNDRAAGLLGRLGLAQGASRLFNVLGGIPTHGALVATSRHKCIVSTHHTKLPAAICPARAAAGLPRARPPARRRCSERRRQASRLA